MKIHSSITLDVVMEAVERHRSSLDNPAFCVKCGAESENDPDACGDECEECGESGVYGAEELLLCIVP